MIRSIKEKPPIQEIHVDLTGPHGNAIVLAGLASNWGRALGWSEERVKAFQKVMLMGDYEGLIKMLDREFGDYVTFWR